MGKIRILMVLGNTSREGAQSYVMNILRNLDKNLFEVDFAVYEDVEGGFGEEMRQLGSQIWIVPRFNGINYFKCVKRWDNIFHQRKYDIVHGHATNAAFIYLKVAKKAGIKTIIHSHSAGFRGNRLLQSIKSRVSSLGPKYADYWFACSTKAAIKLYQDRYLTYPYYYSIPNAIEVSKYNFDPERRNKLRKKYGIAEDTKVIGHLGSFTMPKNHEFLIEIFKEIHQKDPNTLLLLCGDGPLREEIKQKIKDNHLDDVVIMTGNIPDVSDHLMVMDMMVFPSLFEGLPVSLVEAQATGLPVVKSDTITDEVDLTDIIKSKSLEEDCKSWSETALSMKVDNRKTYNESISQTPYNINQSLQSLQRLYIQLIDHQ